MFDIAPSELLLVGTVALVVIGPKDLPKAMRFVGQWVGRARGMARHFRMGIDEIVRQAEMEEMQKKWAETNARIMAEHPYEPEDEAGDAHYARGDDDAVMRPLPAPEAPLGEEGAAAEPAYTHPQADGPSGDVPGIAPGESAPIESHPPAAADAVSQHDPSSPSHPESRT
jgi:sec-independent protein translocase protein TatB